MVKKAKKVPQKEINDKSEEDEEQYRRYIEHEFKVEDEEEFFKEKITEIEEQLEHTYFNIETHLTPDAYEMITSQGEEFKDGGIYIGTGGNLVYYYKKIKYLESKGKHEEVKEALEAFDIAFETNLEVWKLQSMKKRNIPSFFMGKPGILTLAYLVYNQYNNLTKAEQCLSAILNFADLPIEETELLYGTSGLLYCLMLIKDYNPACTRVDEPLMNLTLEIIQHGAGGELGNAVSKESRLFYEFPNGSGKGYVGAAHGYLGILYMLLKAFEFLPLQEIPNECFRVVKNTCEFILSLQNLEGNFPVIEGKNKADLIHFCHGAGGAVPFLLQCYDFYQEDKYLKAAEKAGDLVYTKGILKKGNNLCHGIAGNVYPLFALYRATRDIKWKVRGYCMVNATYIKDIQVKCLRYRDPSRKVIGTADTIYSLMEGRMGLVVMYMDVLTDDTAMKFPGYEI